MAANSGGRGGSRADWTTVIKPFVTYSVGSLSKTEVTTLLRAILDCKADLTASVAPSHPHSVFYDMVTVLSTHIITVATNNDMLPRSSFPLASQAAGILCESLLARFPHFLKATHPILTVKTCLSIIKEFCTGNLILSQEEVSTMLALLKNQELPERIQTTAPSSWDKEGTNTSVKESRRSRLDPSALLFDQISMSVISMPAGEPIKELMAKKVLQIFQSLRASQKFVDLCLALPTLKLLYPDTVNLHGDAIRSLYNRITTKVTYELATLSEELNLVYRLLSLPFFSPLITTDAHHLTQLGISALNGAFIIIQKFYGGGGTTPTANIPATPSESDYLLGISIVSEAIWIQKRILAIFKEDTGLPQWTWLNFSLVISKILIHGLHSYMQHVSSNGLGVTDSLKAEPKTGPQKTGQLSLIAVQSVWNELVTAMASLTVDLVQNFVGMNSFDFPVAASNPKLSQVNITHFKVDTPMLNGERIRLFFKMDSINGIELLTQMMTLSYRKACRLKVLKFSRQKFAQSVNPSEEDNNGNNLSPEIYENLGIVSGASTTSGTNAQVLDTTNQTTTNENERDVDIEDENHSVSDLMTTEDEEEPDEDEDEDGVIDEVEGDDEPILGKWIESVLSPPEAALDDASGPDGKGRDAHKSSEKSGSPQGLERIFEVFVGDKNSPQAFMESALTVLSLLTKHIIPNGNPVIQSVVKASINEQIISLIAIIMKDLDQEKSSTEVGAISTVFDDSLNKTYLDFSSELGKLVQNILAQGLLLPGILTFFLDQLGIDLQGTGRWPLNLYPRSLAVLLQVLLLRSDKETVVVHILKRFLDTLAEGIEDTSSVLSSEVMDIPVEHAQTLAFLFHTLSLMQKKIIMIDTSHTLIRVSTNLKGCVQKESQLLSLSRLLLFFDYLIRQLYEPDLRLVSQVQYNLFDEETALHTGRAKTPTAKPASIRTKSANTDANAISSAQTEPSRTKTLPPSRLFCDCSVGETFDAAKEEGSSSSGPLPKFYNLFSSEPNYQENPKLDGLAMNFLMNKNDANHKDKKEYALVLEAVLQLVELGIKFENTGTVHYVEYLLTRIIFSLPPPVEFLTSVTEETVVCRYSSVLYMMIWLPRLTSRAYSSWLRDIFSKQNVTPLVADELVSNTILASTDARFLNKILQSLAKWMESLTLREGGNNWAIVYGIEAVLIHVTSNINVLLSLDSKDKNKDRDKDATSEKSELELIQSINTILDGALKSVRKSAAGEALQTSKIKSFNHLLALSSDFILVNTLAGVVQRYLEPELKPIMDKLSGRDSILSPFPDLVTATYPHDLIPAESYLREVIAGHIHSGTTSSTSLKHVLGSVVRFLGTGINFSKGNGKTPPPNRSKALKEKFTKMLYPLPLDKTSEFIGKMIANYIYIEPSYALNGKIDSPLTAGLVDFMSKKTLEMICDPELRVAIQTDKEDAFLSDSICCLINFGKEDFFEVLNDVIVVEEDGRYLKRLITIILSMPSSGVLKRICELLSLLFATASKTSESAQRVLEIVTKIPNIEDLPKSIFSPILFQNEDVVEAGCQFLMSLLTLSAQVNILDGGSNERVGEFVPKLLTESIEVTRINMAMKTESEDRPVAFHHVLKVLIEMATICEVTKGALEGGNGHGKLFRQMTEWFQEFVGDMDSSMSRAILGQEEQGLKDNNSKKKAKDASQATLNSILTILEYMLDVGRGLKTFSINTNTNGSGYIHKFLDRESTPASGTGNISPPNEIEENFDLCESEMGDEQCDDEDTGGEDSDDEGLNTKLCTYTITRREFMSQHWYHCHTCGMVDGVGVCSICARVCHKGHDVTYAKLGSFFCDCGAKTDGSCISLTLRPPTAKNETVPPSGLLSVADLYTFPAPSTNPFVGIGCSDGSVRRTSSPIPGTDDPKLKSDGEIKPECSPSKTNIELLHYNRDELMDAFRAFSVKLPLHTIKKLRKIVIQLAGQKTPIGAFLRIREALQRLRSGQGLQFSSNENLMVATLGSQEGAFENIKMQYNGDQGSLIRQLITSQVIRRTTIASMSSLANRRHYLAVSQEKGKLTILQLAALLSGAEMSKKKLTLPRLATVTLPFTALTMATNPIRDDVLAICGLKDCQVLVIGAGGTVSAPIVVSTQLESQNHIIKPVWIMGSQMELAILTSDAVKIFDLGKDTSTPIYHFLLPAGKVRDATFVIQDDSRFIVIMANDGRIYSEKLDESTSTINGHYYITNDLNYDDTEVLAVSGNESNSSGAGPENKGVSLYYSHTLKLLFYSYPNGKSYVGTLDNLNTASPLTKAVLITPKAGGKPAALGLVQWTEVPGHPGLVFAIGSNSNPYILLLTETGSEIQEVRSVGKVKPIDFIAIRHIGSPTGKMRTSLLILSDDGSLRVCDTTDTTEFWLNSRLRPHIDGVCGRLVNTNTKAMHKLMGINRRMSKHTKIPGGQVVFPVDFFEHCQAMNDIDFGGNDLLQIYNTAQLKTRLNNTGMYIASTKSIGFNLEVLNNETPVVMTGLRVLVGTQDVNRVPSFIQVFGRTITVNLTRARWYDIPLTRDESLQSDQKVAITFGPSNDPAATTIVDSVKIYGKLKESFGWPDESEDITQPQTSLASAVSSSAQGERYSEDGLVEKIVTSSLDLCELALTICPMDSDDVEETLSVVTDIYLENFPPFNPSCRSLMSTALANKGAYYEHRDNAVFLRSITQALTLNEKIEQDIDPELFHHVVHCIKNIAIVRPQHIAHHDYDDIGFGRMDVTKIVGTLCEVFRKLVQLKPKNPFVVSLDRPGIQRVELVAMGLAEIIYSLMAFDLTLVTKLCPYLFQLLLSSEREISVPVRTVIVKRMRPKNVRSKRRVTIPGPSPPHCITPETAAESPREPLSSGGPLGGRVEQANLPLVEVDEPIVLLDYDVDYAEGQDDDMPLPPMMNMNPLDAYMGDVDYPPVIDLQSDAEDEAMVELAIALSLQEQAGGAALAIQGLQDGLQALEEMHQEVLDGVEAMSPPEEDEDEQDGDGETHDDGGHMGLPPGGEGGAESDATASPPPSDDEGSTVATEGSTMRNSEMGGSGSSGSSNVGGVASRPNPTATVRSDGSDPGPSGTGGNTNVSDKGNSTEQPVTPGPGTLSSGYVSNRPFRIAFLKAMSSQVSTCTSALSLIPLLQVVLVILSELDGGTEEEIGVVNMLINNLLELMKIKKVTRATEWKRTDHTEMTLVILRMLSICVSRWRGSDQKVENIWIAKCAASTIQDADLVPFLKELLHILRATWKGSSDEPESPIAVIPAVPSVLKHAQISNPPDFTPFFLKQYVKTHSSDVLEELPLLLSEISLRLPYQIKKVLPQEQLFDSEWEKLLCEMLQNRNTPFVRRQARKLLLNIAGTREKYHLVRDLYNMNYHLVDFQKLIGYSHSDATNSGITESDRVSKSSKTEYKYSQLVAMVEHLNTCIDIATQRPVSLQTFCKTSQPLQFILNMSCTADESLTTAILTLLKIAIDGVSFESKQESPMQKFTEEEKRAKSLAHDVIDGVDKRAFLEFIKKFLLEHPQVSTRWQAHSLLLGFFLTSDSTHQLKLIKIMWDLWPFVPAAGSRASQFVDILGYATLNNEDFKSKELAEQVNHCIKSIQQQGDFLLSHSNANLYSSLVPFVLVDGYYLESEPCEVCYNMDKPYSTQKLTNIKADAKFTATNQIIKLTTTLNIIRLSIRLTEVKKVRMIKTMAIYYSPKNISIVDLKNGRNLWQMARKITLAPSQTEVKFDFSVPITAANLILEFIDFYENSQATTETQLQCPRCSASVPAQPGVCSNCGENVFQCHKCRAINYDERDPFLCHSCGFCKYAKMDVTILGKTIVAVDPIENEEDHKKAETAVSSFLEKADQTYKQQQQIKAGLETMLQSIKERRSMAGLSTISSFTTVPTSATVVPAPTVPVPHGSYAAVAAAANALNNNVAVLSIGGGAPVINAPNAAAAAQLLQSSVGGPGPSQLVLKNVQSLAYCYAIDCKNSYEELNRLMRKVGAYRKEMLKLDSSAYPLDSINTVTFRRCYGCMASGITLSLKLLQALMTGGSGKEWFDSSFLLFLLRLSQSAGSTALKEQVKNALCFFVKDDHLATSQLTDIINTRVFAALQKGKETWSDVSFETAEEVSLLASLLQMYDSCWEIKLRCLMKIFTQSVKTLKDPRVRETGLLPCLKIIQNFIRATRNGEKDKLTIRATEGVHVNLDRWMAGDESHSFESWKRRLPKVKVGQAGTSDVGGTSESTSKVKRRDSKKEKKELNTNIPAAPPVKSKETKAEQRRNYLMRKYGRNWVDKFLKVESSSNSNLQFCKELNWVKKLIFYPGSIQTRTVTAALLKDLAQVPQRRLKIMELLTKFMSDLPKYGESCREFMELYRDLATPSEFSAFLNAKGALNIVCRLLDDQIEKLHQLETKTLLSDLSQGIAVWELSRLLSTLAIPSVRRIKRVSLLSTVLGGYLALRRLRLHRTRPIDEAQEILLQLLEEITTGTEEETKVFMTVCVETLRKCPKEDLTTPVFVFERLCSLIVHEESDVAEFYVTLDKDPQQEDFLQGRMLGNPYSSTENGIGPLMRDIKNKICTDCELVALLEDDNGMELLVNNRIISLDLPVKEVYKRIWLPTNGQIEPMRIVYRMRGLLGDATEEFVETFAAPSDGPEDNETTYKSANVLVQCGGLNVVLGALENLMGQPFMMSRGKPFIAVILKLLGYTVKIKAGREAMVSPSLNAVQTLLPILQLCLDHDLTCIQGSSGVVHLTDQMLEILDMILMDACAMDNTAYVLFAKSRGSMEDIKKLLELTDKLKGKPGTMTTHLKVIGCLTYTDKAKMSLIFDSYKDCWDFFKFDEDPNPEFALKLEQVCTLVSNIQMGSLGDTFKDFAIERQALETCLDYIRKRAPFLTSPLGRPDADEWKEMVSKPALKYVLRLLAGLAANHSPTQEAVGRECVYVIHQLEQVSSDEHVGSLAENALEALRSHEKIWKEVEGARRSTREEKKRMAMAMRQRQLNTMGMKTNEKGQVTTAVATILDQMEDLAEETGLICVICREGYKYQPTKVLGIYTFSKRCIVEEHEGKSRKTYSYCTVSHFNVVHVDCHMAAIRLARSRDEWESASLQNANTRCNGLIPLWGQQVQESAFAACLARHNAYLQEATGNRDVGFSSGAHDIKLLITRFAEEKSFHEDTGGGGPESNLHLIPYLIHTALYVLNTTRVTAKESNAVEKFLGQAPSAWKEDWTTVDGPYYHLVVSLMVHPSIKWKDHRILWLKRVLSLCGYRSKRFASAEFANYRPGLIFLALIHGLYTVVFKDVSGTGEWSSILADYIRRNDEALVKSTSALLNLYQQQLITATSIEEFIMIMGLNDHPELKSLPLFISEVWNLPGLI